ncbi:MAG: CDGSH iron-sulfur domain-containing protein [Pyrinomonadaceae bacterium]|nr:CDGSH iron-sulfur domain-containing protein [Phycisphaerales bacterium]
MPRLVHHTATGPIKIDPRTLDPNKIISICACGLSQTFPFCDGAHKACRESEQPGTLYVYAPDNKTITEQRTTPDTGETRPLPPPIA